MLSPLFSEPFNCFITGVSAPFVLLDNALFHNLLATIAAVVIFLGAVFCVIESHASKMYDFLKPYLDRGTTICFVVAEVFLLWGTLLRFDGEEAILYFAVGTAELIVLFFCWRLVTDRSSSPSIH